MAGSRTCEPRWSIVLAITIQILGCGSERDDPLKDLDLAGYSIGRISINNSSQQSVDLQDSLETQFFLRQLTSLSGRREANINNEFDVTVYKQKAEKADVFRTPTPEEPKVYITSLRMGRECIGPMVPASDAVTRWYFENDSLYSFIVSKFHRLPKTAR